MKILTPMILDKNKAAKAIANKLSFNQSTNADIPTLSPCLVDPDSILNVSSVHPLITLENIDASVSYFGGYNYPAYENIAYAKGDVVVESDITYQALTANAAGSDVTDTALWFVMDAFNIHLHSTLLNAAKRSLDVVLNGKKLRKATKTPLESIPLFDGAAYKKDLYPNRNEFVGYRFVVNESNSLATFIPKLSVQLSAPVTFNLYLYHTSSDAPVDSFTVEYTKTNTVQWFEPNFRIDYANNESGVAGGEYYLGYEQSVLEAASARALYMRDLDWVTGHSGCVSCGNRSRIHYQNYSQYVKVDSFRVSETGFTAGTDIFDITSVSMGTGESYGLNLWLSSKCDLTDGVVNDVYPYVEAAGNVAGLELLKAMASSTRDENELSNSVAPQAQKEVVLFDDVAGTVADLTKQSLEALAYDLSNLDQVCLKCDDRVFKAIASTITLS